MSVAKFCPHTQLLSVYRSLCETVDSQYSRRMREHAVNGDWSQIFSSEITPSEYRSASSFAYDYALHSFLRKYEGLADESRLRKETAASFKATELLVRDTNRRLRSGSPIGGVEAIISIAQRKITQILSSSTHISYEFPYREFLEHCEWGKGATSSLKASVATLDNKILEPRIGVTRRAFKYARAYLAYDVSMASARLGIPLDGPVSLLGHEFNISEDGRFDTVPKSWKTRRSIDIQPTFNLFLQKGVGGIIRKRLKRCGINLDDQSRNQWLASIAHKDGYATIDLASASDTVSSELVRLLLPAEWFQVLWDLRTHSINIEGDSCYLHKFSAMGNGYTFELESLIFFALSWAVVRVEGLDTDSKIAVYGDDIIVGKRHAQRLIEVLVYCGFSVNVDKTYTTGRFYESCGKHYFDGVDVTPFYQKEVILDWPSSIRLANRIFRWARRMGGEVSLDDVALVPWIQSRHICDSRLDFYNRKRLRTEARLQSGRRSKIKEIHQLYQPFWVEGDGALLSLESFNYDSNGCLYLDYLHPQSKKKDADNYALLATTLRRGVVVESPFKGQLALRGAVKHQLARRKVYLREREVLTWYNDSYQEPLYDLRYINSVLFNRNNGSDVVS